MNCFLKISRTNILNKYKMNNSTKITLSTDNSLKYPKRLAAFDFDQTIVDDNTDVVIEKMLKKIISIPKSVQDLMKTEGWTRYMEEIFILLHNEKINEETMRKSIREINEVPGMVKCLKTLHNLNFDIIIISDSNSVFIYEWNSCQGLDLFSQIFTNPAYFEENGLLKIKPFHNQTSCKMSAENLCKGKVLQDFIKNKLKNENIKYENIFYVGDGTNDICPILGLSNMDYGCVRKNFRMDKTLTQNQELKNKFQVNLIKWSNGLELLEEILKVVEKNE